MHELGGNPLFLNTNDIQIGRGETISDTAKVLSRFVHGLIVRTYAQADLEELAAHSGLPVVNALTDYLHPCQIYTDAFTAAERWAGPKGDLLAALRGRKIAFLGDTRFNMANSWILGAHLFGDENRAGGTKGLRARRDDRGGSHEDGRGIRFHHRSARSRRGRRHRLHRRVDQHGARKRRRRPRQRRLLPYQVNEKLFALAKKDAFFMHCLPAHAGEEVTQGVLDNPRCIIFDEAENRLHVQKALLVTLAAGRR
ncbi:MAG: ornithine carbamoyltransferase [Lacunisphaera sp.]